MSDADAFGANPFRTLNTKQFPDKKKQGGTQRKPAHQGHGKRALPRQPLGRALKFRTKTASFF